MSDAHESGFTTLWLGVSSDGPARSRQVYRSLADRYAEPGRRYHTMDHVQQCLSQASLVTELIPGSAALELAIWFHDAVYDALASDNEARSAALFRNLAGPVMPGPLVADVARLILVTQSGQAPLQADEDFMVDIDYTSFGLPWEAFLADSLAVRAERPQLTDVQYAVQQSRFLEGLLNRDVLYRTEFFRARYEDNARSNIARYLAMIGRPA